MRKLWTLLLFSGAIFAQDGAAIYQKRCASCHDAAGARVPPLSALRAMSGERVERALTTGVMKAQAEGISFNERYALLGYIFFPVVKTATKPPASAFCAADSPAPDWNGPSWSGWSPGPANTRFEETAAAGLAAGDVPRLKLKWAFGLGSATDARAQASVAGGRIFVGSQTGAVYSLDARSGCMHWTFEADGPVTTAIVIGRSKSPIAYFGDLRANAYALDAATGKLLWKVRVESHFAARVTAAPQLVERTLYVPVASLEEGLAAAPTYECCTFRGSVVALDAATGKRLWQTYTIAQAPQDTGKNKAGVPMHGPSGASVWSTPTYDSKRGAIYIATGNNYSDPPTETSDAVIALDRKTGKILWSRQLTPKDANNSGCFVPPKTNCPAADGPDFDLGQPPILVTLGDGRRALAIGQKSGIAYALDPDRRGEILWQTRVGKGGVLGGIQWGSAADRENLYVAVSDVQMKPVIDPKLPAGFSLDLDPNAGGGLFALRLSDGAKVWGARPAVCGERKHCSPAQSAAVTAIGGVVFSGALDGHLRAYSAATGEVVWDVDTAREYETVNGAKAHGGSIDGPGVTVSGGMLYVNSGYGMWGGMPGNVLLAFSVDGK